MKVIRGRQEGAISEQRRENATGAVWGDPILPRTDGVSINHVFFSPGGRTHWHTHEFGQVLYITGGEGRVCKDGEEPQALRAGDVVWIAPGERHWHGATGTTFLSHIAISIGTVQWQEAVAGAS
jgi:quercetin dioxygenase-like cupin family protein